MNLRKLKRTVTRHLMMRCHDAYEQVLKAIKARGDIWMTSQGEYMRWWQSRENATLKVVVADGVCKVETSLKNAVFEKFPDEFLTSPAVPCAEANFSGEVWLTIDSALKTKDLLIEILSREGILNFRVANSGGIFLSYAQVGALLGKIETKLRTRGRLFENDIASVRQVIIDELAKRGLPLVRIWYHPSVDGRIVKAVFSPRYDVDRAITNLSRIRALEQKYGATSTLYLRAFCPFYDDDAIKALASADWCSEIGLHGEFMRNARQYGDESLAAKAEKEYLERLIGRPIMGVCMHGGELTLNVSVNTLTAIDSAGFLYDTTSGMGFYLPSRPMVHGQLGRAYRLNHGFSDIKAPAGPNYARDFYEQVMEKMEEVYEQHGIFVLMLHPVYFGFFSYLCHPKNFTKLAKFFWNYRTKDI